MKRPVIFRQHSREATYRREARLGLQLATALATALAAALLLGGCASQRPPPVVSRPPAPAPAPAPTPAPQPTLLTPEQQRQNETAKKQSEIDSAKAAAARDPMNWRTFNELGTVYYRQGMYDQAIAAFQQALALRPITTVIEAEKKHEDAVAAHQAALEAQRQAAIQRQKELEQQQQMGEMFSLIGSVAGMKGDMGAQLAVNTMASVSQKINSPATEIPAITAAQKAESSLKDKRETAGIYANLGMAYFGKKSYLQAVAAFDNVTQLDPSRTEVLKVSAEAQYGLCEYENCITTLTRYHAIAPVESPTLLLLFDTYRALGMEPEANKVFQAFLSRHQAASSDAVILLRVGALCLSHYRYAEAVEYLSRVQPAAKDPAQINRLNEWLLSQYRSTNALAWLLASAELGMDQTANAIARLNQPVRNEANPRAWYLLGRAYDQAGDRKQAGEAYRKALEYYGSATPLVPADFYIQICRAANGAGETASAELSSRLAAIPLTPGSGIDQWCLLGLAYEQAGKPVEAMEILNRCNEANSAQAQTKKALERLGKQTQAGRDQALADADAALNAGDKAQALNKLAEAYRLTVAGGKKEDIRKTMLKLAAGMEPAPGMTSEAQDHYLRGNAALKAAKNPADLGRALSEFDWAVFYSPWVGELYFNTSAVKKMQNQTAAAVNDLKLYLAANPNAKNLDELLNRLYEFDYQREQKLRDLAAAAAF